MPDDDGLEWSYPNLYFPLEERIEKKFGLEHRNIAAQSIGSVERRFWHIDYHLSEIDRLRAKQFGGDSFEVAQGRVMSSPENEIRVFIRATQAHWIAAIKALHSIADILGTAIYLSLNPKPDWTGSLTTAVRTAPSGEIGLRNLVDELKGNSDFKYIHDLVNRMKHRNLVSNNLQFRSGEPRVPYFVMSSFEKDGRIYKERELKDFVRKEKDRQEKISIKIFLELIQALDRI